jgi:hypothetical protein
MRLTRCAMIALSTVAIATSRGQAQTSIMLAGGVAVPLGNTSNELKTGYNATVGLEVKPPLAPIGVRLEGIFNLLDFKNAPTGSDSRRVTAFTLNVTRAMPLPAAYVVGGLGVYNSKVIGSAPAQNANTDVGFNVGAGLDFSVSQIGTYIEARYHYVPSAGGALTFVPLTFGIKFGT